MTDDQINELLEPFTLQGRYTGEGRPLTLPAHQGDAGYDLAAVAAREIAPGQFVQIACGVAVELPEGYWAMIQGRSSTWKKGLLVKTSIIDAGFRGQLYLDVVNLSHSRVPVLAGDRLGQLIPMPLAPPIRWEHVEELSSSERGDRGYGSTGA